MIIFGSNMTKANEKKGEGVWGGATSLEHRGTVLTKFPPSLDPIISPSATYLPLFCVSPQFMCGQVTQAFYRRHFSLLHFVIKLAEMTSDVNLIKYPQTNLASVNSSLSKG